MPLRLGVVIPARNEEKFLSRTLSCLILDQEIKPEKVIVVDDGSHDNTSNMASSFDVEVIRLPDRGYQVLGNPILACVINHGLERLDQYGFGTTSDDYVMILGADHILPPNYIGSILTDMTKDASIAVSSGQIEGEQSIIPRGSGRMVRGDFWRIIGLRYPANYGFETYVVIKARQLGYKIRVRNDLITKTQRRTGRSYGKNTYIGYGKGLKALGYSRVYAAGRIGLISLRDPKAAYYMLKGYFSSDIELYDMEFRSYLRNIQHEQLREYLLGRRRSKMARLAE